jgi:DNA-binding transcriptional LysR family regulator
MNLQHLKHFVAVAEELHFGRAAERIGMAQPPLSQSIRRLEDSLGCRLFLRTRRRVELTAAGDTLLVHAREILSQVEYAEKAVQRAREAGISKITIGFTPNALSDRVPAAMREMRRLAPGIDISLWEGRTEEQVAGLMNGALDVAFFHPPERQIRGLDIRTVDRASMVAAIPEGWPLADKPELALVDLADQPLLLFPERYRPDVHLAIVTAFRAAGVMPRISQEAAFDQSRLQLVAAGMGVSLVNASAIRNGYPGVAVRPIVDLPASIVVELDMGWRRNAPAGVRQLLTATFEAIRRC